MANPDNIFVQNFLRKLTVIEFYKSVYVCQSYDQNSSVLFFRTHCIQVTERTKVR